MDTNKILNEIKEYAFIHELEKIALIIRPKKLLNELITFDNAKTSYDVIEDYKKRHPKKSHYK